MSRIAAKVKALRKSRGLNQADFARLLGSVDQSTVSKWETDRQQPKGESLLRLAGLAEESPAEFLGLEKGTAPDVDAEPAIVADETVRKSGPRRHPAFGAWKGIVTLLPDYDYTQPADPDWGKVYDE